jgi:hypothetical protein
LEFFVVSASKKASFAFSWKLRTSSLVFFVRVIILHYGQTSSKRAKAAPSFFEWFLNAFLRIAALGYELKGG